MPRGGARPGAGRKRKDTKTRQLANRELILRSIDADAVIAAAKRMVAEAQGGDARAFSAIAPYLLGSPTQDIEVTGAGGGAIEFTLNLGDGHPHDMDVSAA